MSAQPCPQPIADLEMLQIYTRKKLQWRLKKHNLHNR